MSYEAVTGCTLGSDDTQEREDKDKRRQVSRNLARLRYVVAETRETMKAAIPTTRSRGHVRFAFVFHHPHVAKRPHMVVLSHLTERIFLTNHN